MTGRSVVFTVVTPGKYAAGNLGRRLNRLGVHRNAHTEVIIIDGGSKDGAIKLIAACGRSGTTVFSHPVGAIGSGLNQGIRDVDGAFVLRMDTWRQVLAPAFRGRISTGLSMRGIGFACRNSQADDRYAVGRNYALVPQWQSDT